MTGDSDSASKRPRGGPPQVSGHPTLVHAVRVACESQDAAALADLLSPDVTSLADGGGMAAVQTPSARGAVEVSALILATLAGREELTISEQAVNGQAGLVLQQSGLVCGIIVVDSRADLISDVWIVLNPDKLHAWNRR